MSAAGAPASLLLPKEGVFGASLAEGSMNGGSVNGGSMDGCAVHGDPMTAGPMSSGSVASSRHMGMFNDVPGAVNCVGGAPFGNALAFGMG